jgi:hypothetical protein
MFVFAVSHIDQAHAHAPVHDPPLLTKFDHTDRLKTRFLIDIAAGLAYLHTAGITHANIHSGNVVVDHKFTAKLAGKFCGVVLY